MLKSIIASALIASSMTSSASVTFTESEAVEKERIAENEAKPDTLALSLNANDYTSAFADNLITIPTTVGKYSLIERTYQNFDIVIGNDAPGVTYTRTFGPGGNDITGSIRDTATLSVTPDIYAGMMNGEKIDIPNPGKY